eukprot:2977989-Rhodomonas_salina.2
MKGFKKGRCGDKAVVLGVGEERRKAVWRQQARTARAPVTSTAKPNTKATNVSAHIAAGMRLLAFDFAFRGIHRDCWFRVTRTAVTPQLQSRLYFHCSHTLRGPKSD